MRRDQELLLAADLLFIEASVLPVADLRCKTVDDGPGTQGLVDDGAAGGDLGQHRVVELHAGAVDDRYQILDRERRKRDPHSCHARVPSFVTSEAASVLVTLDRRDGNHSEAEKRGCAPALLDDRIGRWPQASEPADYCSGI